MDEVQVIHRKSSSNPQRLHNTPCCPPIAISCYRFTAILATTAILSQIPFLLFYLNQDPSTPDAQASAYSSLLAASDSVGANPAIITTFSWPASDILELNPFLSHEDAELVPRTCNKEDLGYVCRTAVGLGSGLGFDRFGANPKFVTNSDGGPKQACIPTQTTLPILSLTQTLRRIMHG